MKLLEENIEVNFHVLRYGNGFLDVTPKRGQQKKERNWASSKLKFLCIIIWWCHQNDIIKKVQKHPQNGRKYLQSISDKGLVSEIQKEAL